MKKPAYLLLEVITVFSILLVLIDGLIIFIPKPQDDLIIFIPKPQDDILMLAEAGLEYFKAHPDEKHINRIGYDLHFKHVDLQRYEFTIQKGGRIYYETKVYP